MKRLLLVRHGQTPYNAEGRTISSTDPRLNARGRDQASWAGRILADSGVSVIVSSPRRRCLETASRIADELADDITVATDDRLLELGMGGFEGLTEDEIFERGLGTVFRSWRQGVPPEYPPGAERFELAGRRLAEAFSELAAHRAGSVVFVGHSHALRIMLAVAVLRVDPEAHRRLRLDHGSIAAIDWEGETPRLVGITSMGGRV